VERHGDTATQRSQSKWVDLGVDEVLDRIPSQCPAEAAEIYHYNRAHCCMFLARCLWDTFVGNVVVDEQEDSHVKHTEELDCYSSRQSAFAADEVDEDEGAENGGDEFYKAENRCGEEFFLLTCRAPVQISVSVYREEWVKWRFTS
jgi:hypothetical protein